jgi:hypothetical protein
VWSVSSALVACGGQASDVHTSRDAGADSFEPPADSGASQGVDVGTDVGVVPAWTPASLPGLALWLDGTVGVSVGAGGTLTWLDQSGKGNSAVSVGQPTLVPAGIGGKPAVHFDGATTYLVIQDSPSLQFATDDYAVAIVAAHTTSLSNVHYYGMFYTKQLGVGPYDGVGITANTLAHNGGILAQVADQPQSQVSTVETDFNNGTPFYLVVRRTGGSTLDVRVNGIGMGTATGTGYSIDVSASGKEVNIGGTAGLQDVLGNIAEVIAIHATLGGTDLANLEAYLKAKYGL